MVGVRSVDRLATAVFALTCFAPACWRSHEVDTTRVSSVDASVDMLPTTCEVGEVAVEGACASEWLETAYIKASNTSARAFFGGSAAVALSADGTRLAVGAGSESSDAPLAGAVYVFRREAATWTQEAYLKASNSSAGITFGDVLALSGDGSVLAVAAPMEPSDATGVNGDQANDRAPLAGAVYVFERTGVVWTQVAYLKASNTGAYDRFGASVAISADGRRLAVGAELEDALAVSNDSEQSNDDVPNSGAVYVFRRADAGWTQEAYVKAFNVGSEDRFGASVALSSDGSSMAVGAPWESGGATGIDGVPSRDEAPNSGAVYVFARAGAFWSHEAYVKASNADRDDLFGTSVALSGDGTRLVVGADAEDSGAAGVDADQTDDTALSAGAVYVFARNDATWSQEAYVKSSNTQRGARFGVSVSVSAEGDRLVVGANGESNDSVFHQGAAYVFERTGMGWSVTSRLVASNAELGDMFGTCVALSADGRLLAVGAPMEASDAVGVGGDSTNNDADDAGAVYVFNVRP
jgi:hypothetical protein